MKKLAARLRYFLREAVVNLFRGRAVNALTVGIICASLFILGGFVLLVSNLRDAVAAWNRVAIIVYLKDDAPEAVVSALRAEVEGSAFVQEVRYVSRDQAAAVFRERFAHLAETADEVGGNPFPASLEILARGDRDGRMGETESLLASLRSNGAVEEVRDSEAESKKVLALIRLISAGGWVVGGILAVASLFTIFNVIRLTVYQRRDEVAIMRLVGATSGFIRGPFLLEGTLQGIIGALAAEGLLFLAYGRMEDYAASTANPFLQLLTAGFLTPSQAGAILLGGTILGATGSLLSLRRFLTG